MKVGDKVKAGYGIGVILAINGSIATVKFSNPIPLEFSIAHLKVVYDFKAGQLVKMPNGIKGVVIKVENNRADIETVLSPQFEKSIITDVSNERVEFIESIGSEYVANNYNFVVGKTVNHDKYGIGTLISLYEKNALIKYEDGFRIIEYSKLEPTEVDLTEEIEERDVESDEFVIIPSHYSDSEYYSTLTKKVLTWARKHFDSGFASAQSFVDEKQNTLGLIVEKTKGVIVFKIIDGVNNDNFDIAFDSLGFIYDDDSKFYLKKFLNSKALCNYSKDGLKKILKFPLRFVYVLPNVEYNDLTIVQRKKFNECRYAFARRFKSGNLLLGNFEEYDPSFEKIDPKLYPNILERVIPENCTLLLGNENKRQVSVQKDANSVQMVPINGKEQEFVALSLDDDEIRIINNTKPGHWLTLANPGTGKSVILLSKAYRLVSMNKNSKVMITCYNNNLCEHHTIFKERTGLRAEGLYVERFFKVVFDLLDAYGVDTRRLDSLGKTDEKYDMAVQLLYDYVSRPNFIPIYDAIFIDEVQLFKPLWLMAAKKLLKQNGYFELYGDLNQNVRTSDTGLKTPWKDKRLELNWQGHTRYLEKNYRNTQNINDYINKLIEKINLNVKKYHSDFELDDTKLPSISSRDNKRKVYISRCNESDMPNTVLHWIKEVHDKWHTSYDDIAIIFPVSYLGNYQPFEKIKRLLEKTGIDNCQIFGTHDVKSRLNDTNGIIFSTIDSSLGLDFDVVIVCGTAYWQYYWVGKTKHSLTQNKLESGDNSAITAYCEYGRKLYSACSRARNGLIIIDDLPKDYPIQKLIKKEVE